MRVKKLFFATALLWYVLCGHCGKIVVVVVVFSLSVLFVAE
jgi:hypothetical protein